jgi:hypothetical protein
MGVDYKKAPPLPAPTETESTTATELATDVSKPADEKSSYSLPEDGTPVTIKTRGHKASRSQTSLLIEYFEGGKSGAAGSHGDRKPSVRVRLTPSKKNKDGHIQVTETKGSRKASLTRRIPLSPATPLRIDGDGFDVEDAKSMSSYASATEESNVSKNIETVEVDIDHSGRRRRPASPLIPSADSKVSYQHPGMSDISAIPTDSFLDGSGPTKTPDGKRSRSPSRGEALVTGAAAGLAAAAAADKLSGRKSRERVVVPKSSEKSKDKSDRKHRSSKSRTSSISEKHVDDARSPRRRSSRGHQESLLSVGDSSVLSSNISHSRSADQQSVRSGASRSSINNPKLLETVEDAIRRLILPELSALKREHSKREARRGSLTSTGTSVSREDLATDRRKSSSEKRDSRDSTRYKERRDREARHGYADSSPLSVDRESLEETHEAKVHTPHRSGDKLKAAVAGVAIGALAAGALNETSPSDEKRQRRRRRTDSARSRSRGREKYLEEFEEDHTPAPPMPLMSEINPSEMTRTSILSAATDRPHSAADQLTPVHEVPRGALSAESSPTPTRTPATLQQTLGTKHANISHGDLRDLPRERTDEFTNYDRAAYGQNVPPQAHAEYDDNDYDDPAQPEEQYEGEGFEHDYYNTQDVPPPLKYVPYQPERRGLSPIYSVSGYTEGGSEVQQARDSRAAQTASYASTDKSPLPEADTHSPGSVPSNVMSREFDQHSTDDRSLRSSGVEYRNTTYTDDSEVDRVTSGQAVRGVGANPNFVNVPIGVESAVASLVDGSMLEQSVLTTGSGYDYGHRESVASLDDRSKSTSGRNTSPGKRSVESQRLLAEERGPTPTSSRNNRSEVFEEYDLDEYGRKVPRSAYRQSPTASEAAITAGAVGAAAAALKAAAGRRSNNAPIEVLEDDFMPAGVSRNKSFKERTLEGRAPASTPARSIDRLYYETPKLGATGIPDMNDPIPEIGYVEDDDLQTNPSVHERFDHGDEHMSIHSPSMQYDHAEIYHKSSGHGLGVTEAAAVAMAAGAGAALAASHSRQASQDQDEEWHRTSAERKRDTLVTNPYDGASPIVNPELNDNLLGVSGFQPAGYSTAYHAGSPGIHAKVDEGYISQGPNRTPDIQNKDKAVDFMAQGAMHGVDDPFYVPKGHDRRLSGLSQGMGSPLYDATTGTGIDRIESKDIIALMQHVSYKS